MGCVSREAKNALPGLEHQEVEDGGQEVSIDFFASELASILVGSHQWEVLPDLRVGFPDGEGHKEH